VAKQSQAALSSGTVLGAGKQERAPMARGVAAEPDFRQNVLGSPLDPRYTFGSFVEGPSNRVAFAAARAVAESASSA
ncbi:DnaA ATPase domain-containing protein, partial [Klebsiella pneumoniae]